ncbi:hypothetical protein [Nocardia xishanensis]|uniref:hypothetical protein n=1 Tax=Nocardia xishanensis TaxID=238964 RepID=UPI00083689BA|nr:hypothetical protein [Nocardia xishanensis]
MTITPRPAPILTETHAADQVCGFRLPFLFYTDHSSGRGHLIYRRDHTDLGTITPPAAPPTSRPRFFTFPDIC